jgi:hypothetical protein
MGLESICPSTIIFFFVCLVAKFERLVLEGMRLVDFIEGKLLVFDTFGVYSIIMNKYYYDWGGKHQPSGGCQPLRR